MSTGRYIVIEGQDGTGKSTQVRQIRDHLLAQGQQVTIVEEPGSDNLDTSTAVANYLRSVIVNGSLKRDNEINLALFSAARRDLWQQKIKPGLDAGHYVVASRNYYSTMAYQGYGEGLDINHIIDTTKLFTDPRYMQPDHMVILTLDDHIERTKRVANRADLTHPDPFESRGQDFQQSVDQAYVDLASKNNLPLINCVDKSIDQVQAELIKLFNL